MNTPQGARRPPHIPMRTCVGCRTVRPQAELVRTRCPGGRITPACTAPSGRSAYVCPLRACVELAVRKGGFRRSFRSNATADTETLWTALASDVERHNKRSGMHASGRNA
jgi:predicted RNA-binding protein YlxR (DUF448 family)